MFEKCVETAAQDLYPTSPEKRERMQTDCRLLLQSLKTSLPLLMMTMIGWSFSIISVALEGILMYYFYNQLIGLYTGIRGHNPGIRARNGDGDTVTPDTELYHILKNVLTECLSMMQS